MSNTLTNTEIEKVVSIEKIVSLIVVLKTDQLEKLMGKRSLRPYLNRKTPFLNRLIFRSQLGYSNFSDSSLEVSNKLDIAL